MTRVIWASLNPHAGERGAWDQSVIEELTADPEFQHETRGDDLWGTEGAVVVIAGQHNAAGDAPARLADRIAGLDWSLVLVSSDEERLFNLARLPIGPSRETWLQYHASPYADRLLPIGVPPGTGEVLEANGCAVRNRSIVFAGQDTHERRHELLGVLKDLAVEEHPDMQWLMTTGFRLGYTQDAYLGLLQRTRLAPCPSGPHSLDSFRLYESLAAGALPIIETHTPHGYEAEFWTALFGEDHPIPTVDSWLALPVLADEYADGKRWRAKRDEVQRWWAGFREDLEIGFARTIARLRES